MTPILFYAMMACTDPSDKDPTDSGPEPTESGPLDSIVDSTPDSQGTTDTGQEESTIATVTHEGCHEYPRGEGYHVRVNSAQSSFSQGTLSLTTTAVTHISHADTPMFIQMDEDTAYLVYNSLTEDVCDEVAYSTLEGKLDPSDLTRGWSERIALDRSVVGSMPTGFSDGTTLHIYSLQQSSNSVKVVHSTGPEMGSLNWQGSVIEIAVQNGERYQNPSVFSCQNSTASYCSTPETVYLFIEPPNEGSCLVYQSSDYGGTFTETSTFSPSNQNDGIGLKCQGSLQERDNSGTSTLYLVGGVEEGQGQNRIGYLMISEIDFSTQTLGKPTKVYDASGSSIVGTDPIATTVKTSSGDLDVLFFSEEYQGSDTDQ
jgi:hypothetical protein